MIEEIEAGLYKHFKGTVYEVLFCAWDVDKDDLVVVYRDGLDYYTRLVSTWYDLKTDPENGETLNRFIKIN